MNTLREDNNNTYHENDSLQQSLAVIEICKDLLEHKKRDTQLLFIALMVSICINVAIVGLFLWQESKWEYSDTITTTTEQTVDGESNDIVNGNQYNDQSQDNSGGK